MTPRQLAIYLYLAASWGFTFVLLLHAVDAFGWAGAVAFRSLLAAAILLVAAKAMGRPLRFEGRWADLAIAGAILVAAQLALMAIGLPRIGTAMSAIFVAAIPLFSMVISQMWGLERMTGRGLTGIGLGAAGIVMLVGFPSEPVTGSFLFGCACALGAAFCAAYGSNHVSRHLRGIGAWEVTIATALAGGILMLPVLWFVPVPRATTLTDLAWLFALAAIIGALNYTFYFELVAQIGPTKTISVEFLVTVVAVSVGTLLLGEKLTLVQLVGAATIIGGCALVLGLFGTGKKEIQP